MSKVEEFQRATRKQFAFLKKRGFSGPQERLDEHVCSLTYTSPEVSLSLYYGPPEFEPSLSFRLRSVPTMSFGVGDLVFANQRPDSWVAGPGTEGLEADVSWLACAIHSVERQLCSGDPEFYELLSTARAAATSEWQQAEKLRAMRSNAETAWRNKHYAELVALYESAIGSLSELERKRLKYAEKKAKEIAK